MQLTGAKQIKRINLGEVVFRNALLLSALLLGIILLARLTTLVVSSIPSIKAIGIQVIYGKTWNPVEDNYGGLPFLIGTLLTSLLALVISIPFSLAVGLFLGEYFTKGFVSGFFKNIIELLAAIPSVVYGFCGMFILVPFMRSLETSLGVPPYGVGIFTASIILSIMIIPYSVSLIRQVIMLVENHNSRELPVVSLRNQLRGRREYLDSSEDPQCVWFRLQKQRAQCCCLAGH